MSLRPTLEQISPKLDLIARCIERIESKKPFTLRDLESNLDLQDIISINLERAIQQTVDIAIMIISRSAYPIPGDMAESFVALKQLGCIDDAICERMRKSIDFRNAMVHEYEKLNWEIVYKVATIHFVDLKNYSKQIIQFVSK